MLRSEFLNILGSPLKYALKVPFDGVIIQYLFNFPACLLAIFMLQDALVV